MQGEDCIRVLPPSGTSASRSLLAVYAHPDDESFGPARTLGKYAQEGARVWLLTITRGEAGMRGDLPIASPEELARQRAGELLCACQVIGIERLCLLEYPDGRLAEVDPPEIRRKIVAVIRRLRPQVIITFGPEGVTGHPDHIAVSALTTQAALEAGDARAFPDILSEEIEPFRPARLFYHVLPHSVVSEWQDSGLSGVPDETIDAIIDTSELTVLQWEALKCHRTQRADVERFMLEDRRENEWHLPPRDFFQLALPAQRPKTPLRDLFESLEEERKTIA